MVVEMDLGVVVMDLGVVEMGAWLLGLMFSNATHLPLWQTAM
jgi:hypothetical protein